jgi:hypothetical protein
MSRRTRATRRGHVRRRETAEARVAAHAMVERWKRRPPACVSRGRHAWTGESGAAVCRDCGKRVEGPAVVREAATLILDAVAGFGAACLAAPLNPFSRGGAPNPNATGGK